MYIVETTHTSHRDLFYIQRITCITLRPKRARELTVAELLSGPDYIAHTTTWSENSFYHDGIPQPDEEPVETDKIFSVSMMHWPPHGFL